MKTNAGFIVFLVLASVVACCSADAQDQSAPRQRIVVVPFRCPQHCVPLFSDQIAWMLDKKLKMKGHETIDRRIFMEPEPVETDEKSERRKMEDHLNFFHSDVFFARLAEKYPAALVIRGRVKEMDIDSSQKKKGSGFIGICTFPIYISIHAECVAGPEHKVIWEHESRSTDEVPRIRVFGFHRTVFPKNPRSIDSLIHEAVIDLASSFSKSFQ